MCLTEYGEIRPWRSLEPIFGFDHQIAHPPHLVFEVDLIDRSDVCASNALTVQPCRSFMLYETLGVPRTATQDDIKRTYRMLARKYHPVLSKLGEAEERFKEVGEAYKMLKPVAQRPGLPAAARIEPMPTRTPLSKKASAYCGSSTAARRSSA